METCNQEQVLGVAIVKLKKKGFMVSGLVSGGTASALGFTQGIGNLLTPVMGEGHSPCVTKRADVGALGVVAPLSCISDFSEDTQIHVWIYLDLAQGRLGPKV